MKKFLFLIFIIALLVVLYVYMFNIEPDNQDKGKRTVEPEHTVKTGLICIPSPTPSAPVSPIPSPTPSEVPTPTVQPVLEAEGFVNIQVLDPRIIVELRYATTNNFTNTRVYDYSIAILRKSTALKLAKVSEEVAKDGYRIKIWDAYRRPEASWKLWEFVKNPKYVSNPDLQDKHCKGAAVDVTLVDSEGRELVMPTEFDTFTEEASGKNAKGEAYENWQYLKKVMERNGFRSISSEWWHYNDKDVSEYDVVDIDVNRLFGAKDE